MSLIRTFIAIQIPAEMKKEIGTLQEKFKSVGKSVSWVRPENIHVTLKFLGDTNEARIDEIEGKIKLAVSGVQPFQIEVKGVGAFPNLRRPRVIWVGAASEPAMLETIVEKLEKNLKELGFKPEDRKFTAHLTIGRVKDAPDGVALSGKVQAFAQFNAGSFETASIELIKSDLLPTGARYTTLRKIVLLN
ncbi:MAG: RNA 2',3'-cyclic phosphodiesterase [Candidatus Zhuqueibacterota bacterium]